MAIKTLDHSQKIFHGFLLVIIISIAAVWAVEEYLGIVAQQDRYGYLGCLVVLPFCLYFSYVKHWVAKTRIFVYFFLTFYLMFLTSTSFIHSAITGEMYSAASSLQWVPSAYIVSFLFFPMRIAVVTVFGFYSLMISLLLISYTEIFPEVSSELHAMYINALFAQGLYILCLFGVMKLREAKNEATNYADKMEKAANIDGLLGIGNRRMLQNELDTMASGQTPFSLLLIDIDFFKAINDTHGHLVGDDVLREITHCIEQSLRPDDTLGRWGGEEFLLLAYGTELEQAKSLAERIRKTIESTEFSTVGKVTISIGVTQFKANTSISHTFSIADKALYQAKHSGRNRVIVVAQD
jgi:diguanylate cyclase (GGDEF)-like protein